MKTIFATLIFILAIAASAHAQVKQSGKITPGHIATWTTNEVIQDGGAALHNFTCPAGQFINGFNVTTGFACATGGGGGSSVPLLIGGDSTTCLLVGGDSTTCLSVGGS